MQLLRTIIAFLALAMMCHSVFAGTPTFIAYPFICDAIESGTFQQATAPDRYASAVVYHQVLNYQIPRRVSACADGVARFQDSNQPCDNREGLAFTMSKFDVVCRNGVMSALDMTQHIPGMVLLARSGSCLVFLQTPTYPASDRVIARYSFPAGYGMLEDRHSLPAQPQAIDARILNPRIFFEGMPPGKPTPVRNIFYDTAPVTQYGLALLVAFYAGFVNMGSFHNKTSTVHPTRPIFPILIMAALAGLYFSTHDPAPDARNTYQRAQEMMQTIDADRAKLASVLTVRNGLIEPFTQQQYQAALSLMSTHVIPDTTNFQSSTNIRVGISLVPLVLFLVLFIPYAIAGWYHLFIKPPIEKTLKPALASGGPIDMKAAAAVLKPDINEARNPPPAYQSDSQAIHLKDLANRTENQAAEFAERAARTADHKRSLVSKLNVTGRLMQAINRRESKRRELEEEERLVRETEQRLAKQDDTA